jgi:hypothetical protein
MISEFNGRQQIWILFNSVHNFISFFSSRVKDYALHFNHHHNINGRARLCPTGRNNGVDIGRYGQRGACVAVAGESALTCALLVAPPCA